MQQLNVAGKANLMKNILLVGSPKCSVSKNVSKMCAVYQTLGKTLSPKTVSLII